MNTKIRPKYILSSLLLALTLPTYSAADVFTSVEGPGNSLTNSTDCDEGIFEDWHTWTTNRNSDVSVLSIHGGYVEIHTSQISYDLANLYGWNRFDFSGHLKNQDCKDLATDGNPNNNNHEVLHVTSKNFDHSDARNLVQANPHAISLHGCGESCSDNTVCIGGQDIAQVSAFEVYMNLYSDMADFTLHGATVPTAGPVFCNSNLAGVHSDNIVNDTTTGQGLQLEMSRNVRDRLVGASLDDDLVRGIIYGAAATAMGEMPPPLAVLDRVTSYQRNNVDYNRFYLSVENWSEYPGAIFDSAPHLPPCGANANSARTWVRIYDASDDSYVYGFCNLGAPSSLTKLWFARQDGLEPAEVYIELQDRETGRNYRSNRIAIQP